MYRRSALNTVIDDCIREIEGELEAEVSGAEFDQPPARPQFRWKWQIFVPQNGGWKKDRDMIWTEPLTLNAARGMLSKMVERWRETADKSTKRVLVQTCYRGGDDAWKLDAGGCKVVNAAKTSETESCGRGRPKFDCE